MFLIIISIRKIRYCIKLQLLLEFLLMDSAKYRGECMKNFKMLLLALCALFMVNLSANAECTIGYVNYKQVESNYDFAKNAYKEVDSRYLELQQFLMDKEKQYKNIESPINKKNFEENVQKDFKVKNDDFTKFKMQKAQEIETNILNATKAVAAQKKIDIVVDYSVIYTGGIDISQDVINYLNSKKK